MLLRGGGNSVSDKSNLIILKSLNSFLWEKDFHRKFLLSFSNIIPVMLFIEQTFNNESKTCFNFDLFLLFVMIINAQHN